MMNASSIGMGKVINCWICRAELRPFSNVAGYKGYFFSHAQYRLFKLVHGVQTVVSGRPECVARQMIFR